MRPDELLVGGLALIASVAAFAIGAGPWQRPYRLRKIAAVRDRFGMLGARVIWLFAGAITLLLGGLILSGKRPDYAVPESTPKPADHIADDG